ncbi:MAG: UDP-N-acetylmuramate dehydrogenase [Oligoflexia bacterium]|nr:UDP-N-acetylmuramate dehydrogenase [Oligoflexia bacterium]
MSNIECLKNEPLSKHTTYRIGGAVDFMFFPKTNAEVKIIGEFIQKNELPYFVLGNGSNLLAPTEALNGVIINTKKWNIEILEEKHFLKIGAGVLNAKILRYCGEHGLSGLEYLSGVPGTFGGAIYMNAGTRAEWVSEVLESIEIISLKGLERTVEKKDFSFSYRHQSILFADELVSSGFVRLKKVDKDNLKKNLVDMIQKRKRAQPIEMPSCGSVFRNPEGENSWRLIDECGLRGKIIGAAQISPKHSNFIVNLGGATKEDVLSLIQLAKESVKDRFGIDLVEEVKILEMRFLQ